VYKTINSILHLTKVLNEQKRAKKLRKRKLKASEEKCSWRLALLKIGCSWSDDVIRSCLIRSYISPEAQVHQNPQNLKLQELFLGSKFILHWQKTSGIMQRSFQKDLKSFGCKDTKSVDKCTLYELYNHYSVLCLYYKTRITALKYNHACNNFPSQLEWIKNWSFIEQYLNQARNHW